MDSLRVTLRKVEPTDLPFLYEWENDSRVWQYGATHNPLSHSDLQDYIESTTGDAFRDGQLRLIICLDGASAGCVDLYDIDVRNRKAGMGVYVSEAMRGRGAGQEAVRQMEQLAFGQMGLRMLYAVVSEANEAGNRLYKQLNYQPSARLKDWTLEGDAQVWQKRNISL